MAFDSAQSPSSSSEAETYNSTTEFDPYFRNEDIPDVLLKSLPTKVDIPPFTFTRRLIHWSEDLYERNLKFLIYSSLGTFTATANRFPTQPESDALVELTSNRFDIPPAAGWIGGIFGVLLARNRKPAFLDPKDPAILGDQLLMAAVRRRRIMYFSAVLPICFFAGYFTAESLTSVAVAVSGASDQRLRQYATELSKGNQKAVVARQQRFRKQRDRWLHSVGLMAPGQVRPPPPSLLSLLEHTEDANPVSSYSDMGESYGQQSGSQLGSSKILNEIYSQQEGGYASQPQQTVQSPPQPSASLRESESFWDDASPTNPDIDPSPQASPGTGSVWEQIRRSSGAQAAFDPRGSAPQASSPEQQSFSDQWKSSDYGSDKDSGDRYAKDKEQAQAQREFDRVVEREREFGLNKQQDDGSSWGKRW